MEALEDPSDLRTVRYVLSRRNSSWRLDRVVTAKRVPVQLEYKSRVPGPLSFLSLLFSPDGKLTNIKTDNGAWALKGLEDSLLWVIGIDGVKIPATMKREPPPVREYPAVSKVRSRTVHHGDKVLEEIEGKAITSVWLTLCGRTTTAFLSPPGTQVTCPSCRAAKAKRRSR